MDKIRTSRANRLVSKVYSPNAISRYPGSLGKPTDRVTQSDTTIASRLKINRRII